MYIGIKTDYGGEQETASLEIYLKLKEVSNLLSVSSPTIINYIKEINMPYQSLVI